MARNSARLRQGSRCSLVFQLMAAWYKRAVTDDRPDPTEGEIEADRRIHHRFAVELRVVEMEGQTAYFRFATNLSAGGLFIEGPLPHPIGTKLTLVFIVPGDDEPSSVPCEVVASTEGEHRGNHIKFLLDDASDVARSLGAYVRAKTVG